MKPFSSELAKLVTRKPDSLWWDLIQLVDLRLIKKDFSDVQTMNQRKNNVKTDSISAQINTNEIDVR